MLLNDFQLIEDLCLPRVRWRYKLEELGDEARRHIRTHLPKALEAHSAAVLALHVPPFREAAWHEGKPSRDDWLPFFSCKAAGDAILEVMRARPARRLTVLCGHTHGSGECNPLPNVKVLTGGAEYGRPNIQRIFDLG